MFFFFNDTATTEIYTLSLHDALPIFYYPGMPGKVMGPICVPSLLASTPPRVEKALLSEALLMYPQESFLRSEEHTSELQSRQYLVCRLLLEKKTHTSHSIPSIGHSHH